MKFSANLGFLWTDRSLPDAIRAAKAAGFDAVECHWPYDEPVSDVIAALHETGLTMQSLNTRRGNVEAGDNGLSAIPSREAEAKEAIDEAIAYAHAIGALSIHVMAGKASGPSANRTFINALSYASEASAIVGITTLIEPLNTFDTPGYFLTTTDQAIEIINDVGAPNLNLLFDCYHVHLMEGAVIKRLKAVHQVIGHIQFASLPDRGAPDHGDVNYTDVFDTIKALGLTMPLGAEYKPKGRTEQSLGWLEVFK